MDKDDQVARKVRAEHLRKQISRFVDKPDTAQDTDELESSQDEILQKNLLEEHLSSENSRNFIQRRMREIDRGKHPESY